MATVRRGDRSEAARKGWETRRRRAAEKEAARAKRSAAAKKGWETRRARANAGDLARLNVAVFRPFGARGWDSISVLHDAATAIARATGGRRHDTSHWQTVIEFRVPKTSATLADDLNRVDWASINLQRGRLHIGAITLEGQYLPLSRAYGDTNDVRVQALTELDNDIQRYRSRGQDDGDEAPKRRKRKRGRRGRK